MKLLLIAIVALFWKETINNELYDYFEHVTETYNVILSPLSLEPFFRVTKADLQTPCNESYNSIYKCSEGLSLHPLLDNNNCNLNKCEKESLPSYLITDMVSDKLLERLQQKDNIWVYLNCGEKGETITLYDLEVNKEGYTGYGGNSSHRIWSYIYDKVVQNSAFDDFLTKLISGLHSSVAVHVANSFPKDTCIKTVKQKLLYKIPSKINFNNKNYKGEVLSEVVDNTERVYNMLLLANFLEYAISLKIEEILETFDELKASSKCSKHIEKKDIERIKELIAKVDWEYKNRFKSFLDEQLSETDITSEEVLNYKKAFEDVQKVLNCVECSKCKLWGKLQVHGIATAFTVLFNGNGNKLSEEEIHWLIRTYIKTQNSVRVFYEGLIKEINIGIENKETKETKTSGLGSIGYKEMIVNFGIVMFIVVRFIIK